MIVKATESLRHGLEIAATLIKTRMIRPTDPRLLPATIRAFRKWGPTQPMGYAIGAKRMPKTAAIIDDRGTLTYKQVHERTNQLAHALLAAGIDENSRVAILCRNHRGFIEAFVATVKTGADALLMNTQFAGPQLLAVIEDQNADAVVLDEEFLPLLAGSNTDRPTFIAWADSDDSPLPTLDDLRTGQSVGEPPRPSRRGRTIILTSGTTGVPKGAARAEPKGIAQLIAVVNIIPYRYRDQIVVAAPLFHAWGFANFSANLIFHGTVILHRRFDPEQALASIDRHRASMMAVVPVMLQRLLDVPSDVRTRYDLSCLRAVNASGSALPGELATEFMDEFGDVLYNLYGSTEVAWVTIASPRDMRRAPGTAGRPPTGTIVKIVDDNGVDVPRGETGQIFVKHDMVFEGYTKGETTNRLRDMVGTGDLGHLDRDNLLFVDGRIDEMIVSGGENIYPIEVEDVIAKHPEVYETAVVGVKDDEFGERLKAFVVKSNGSGITADVLKEHVRDNLARYKVPREIIFIDELPRNATGKILKRELKQY